LRYPIKLALLLALAALVSCGKSSSPGAKNERSIDPLCGSEQRCLAAPAWTITSTPVNFPRRFQIFANDVLVADNCRSTRVRVAPAAGGRVAVTFNSSYLPKTIDVVRVVDRGEACDNDAIFHQEDRPAMAILAVTVSGTTTYTVSVTLGN
jgi:hypothetical protein